MPEHDLAEHDHPITDYIADALDADETPGPAPESEAEPAPGRETKPGEQDYDWSQHYDTDDLYLHTFPDGTVVGLKSFASIYSKTWLYKMQARLQDPNFTDVDLEFASINRAACPTAREVLLALDDSHGDPLDDLWKAWLAAGTSHGDGDEGLTPGKSSG